MLRMTHPSRNFFVLCLCMFKWLRVHGFESSVHKEFQKEKLVNSKTINLQSSNKGVSSAIADLGCRVKQRRDSPLISVNFL